MFLKFMNQRQNVWEAKASGRPWGILGLWLEFNAIGTLFSNRVKAMDKHDAILEWDSNNAVGTRIKA